MRVTVRDAHVRLGQRGVLNGARLDVRPGRVVGILGPSGSGKTTLLRVAHLLLKASAGSVEIDGATVAPGSADALAASRRMGLVQQRPGFLRARLDDNVALPLRVRGTARAEARSKACRLLERVGLGPRSGARPDDLSGGELQRVALARALAAEPDVLLLDEFTNHLDPAREAQAEAIVHAAAQAGTAVAFVTHKPSQARRIADEIVFLVDGRVVAEGPAAAVLDEPAVDSLAEFLERA